MAEVLTTKVKRSGRGISEAGAAVALSLLLSFFSFSPLPSGGQISLDMLPILLLAELRGFKTGASAGAVYGMLHLIQEPVTLHPLQVMLDYPLAYGSLGLAGLGIFAHREYLGIISGMTARLLMHTISGVIFIDMFLQGSARPESPLLWSLTYNGSFMALPALIMLIALPPIKKAMVIGGFAGNK